MKAPRMALLCATLALAACEGQSPTEPAAIRLAAPAGGPSSLSGRVLLVSGVFAVPGAHLFVALDQPGETRYGTTTDGNGFFSYPAIPTAPATVIVTGAQGYAQAHVVDVQILPGPNFITITETN